MVTHRNQMDTGRGQMDTERDQVDMGRGRLYGIPMSTDPTGSRGDHAGT